MGHDDSPFDLTAQHAWSAVSSVFFFSTCAPKSRVLVVDDRRVLINFVILHEPMIHMSGRKCLLSSFCISNSPVEPMLRLGGNTAWAPRAKRTTWDRVLLCLASGGLPRCSPHGWYPRRFLFNNFFLVPDAQCAWQVLLQCVSAMCRHITQTLRPSLSEWSLSWAVCQAMQTNSLRHATLLRYPCAWEGLDLRSATRMAAASCWTSWADALGMVSDTLPWDGLFNRRYWRYISTFIKRIILVAHLVHELRVVHLEVVGHAVVRNITEIFDPCIGTIGVWTNRITPITHQHDKSRSWNSTSCSHPRSGTGGLSRFHCRVLHPGAAHQRSARNLRWLTWTLVLHVTIVTLW